MGLIIRCPSCPRQLRVPEELLGQDVKCPSCGVVFKATEDQGPPAAPAPEQKALDDEPPARDDRADEVTERPGEAAPRRSRARAGYDRRDDDDFDDEDYDEDRPRRRGGRGREAARARVSGPATALIVTGGIGLALGVLGLGLTFAGAGMGGRQGRDPAELAGNVVGTIIGFVFSGLIIAGAQKMKNLESYGFAMTAAILAMLPCGGCCLIGLPFGIWALVVLSDAQVKDAFR